METVKLHPAKDITMFCPDLRMDFDCESDAFVIQDYHFIITKLNKNIRYPYYRHLAKDLHQAKNFIPTLIPRKRK